MVVRVAGEGQRQEEVELDRDSQLVSLTILHTSHFGCNAVV